MGVTIHYKGRLNDLKEIGEFVGDLADFAQALGWQSKEWNSDLSDPTRASLLNEEDGSGSNGDVSLSGIVLFPHIDCEPLWLTFGPVGSLTNPAALTLGEEEDPQERWLSTKSQFAPIHVHTGIIRLLHHLKKRYITNLEVHDEGGYWESGDFDQLKRRLDSITHALDVLGAALSESQSRLATASSSEELVGMIEKIFRDKFGDGNG